jgi:endonuclease/exonuclease/phosphatase family metal-dependent hydrolase
MSARLHRFLLFPLAGLIASLVTIATPAQTPKSRSFLFCFWNVENLFDDKPNPKLEKVDREFDTWYAKDPQALTMKLERIADVLLSKEINGGKGPDILALAEVESLRAVELVRDALHKRLKDKSLHYKTVVFKDPQGGRSIATALLSRVPVTGTPKLLGRAQRILVVKLMEGKHELTVVASHWSSRVSDKTGRGRSSYAQLIHNDFKTAFRKDVAVDYLVCGDFNDTPSDDSVRRDLGAIGDLKKVLSVTRDDPPLFFNPLASFEKNNKGTHYFAGRAYVFDHICLSPGLLDGEGWAYVNNSATIIEKLTFRGRPDRFGGPDDKRPWRNRGASDHYPVTIQLRVGR